VSTFPYIEDFEEEGALQCWKIYRYGDSNDTIQWERTTVYSHSEKHSFYHNTPPVDETVKKDGWLVSPKMRIPADGAHLLSFWSFNEFPDFYGKNSVWISDGSSDPSAGKFKEIWTTASISRDWREARINLADYAGDSIYIAFRYEGMYSHRWYIDDVKIERLPDKDLGVMAIVSPVSGDNLTASEPAIIRVRNYGSRAQSNIPVKIEMGNLSLSGIVPSLAVNSEVEYTFSGTLDLSEEKSYSLRASISLEGDVNNSNDTVWQTATNHGNLAVMGSRSPITTCDISFVADGIENDYRLGKETQIMTFYPAITGNKIKAEFTDFVTYPDMVDGWGIKYHGDTLFVYNGNTADADKLLASLTGYKTGNNLPKSFISSAQDGSLTFVFKKLSNNLIQGYEGDLGWNAAVTCIKPVYLESINAEQGKVYAIDGKLYVSGFPAGASATVYNTLGQKVLTQKININTSLIDKLHPGIYVINVQWGKKQSHFKVLIK
jgi:hypothetical protein